LILIVERLLNLVENKLFKKKVKEDVVKDKKEHEHKHCEICYLQNENSPDVTFHLYEDGSYCYPGDKYICQKCLDWVHFMRKLASEQAGKPESEPFKDVTWWWQPKKEGMSAAEMVVK